MTDYKAARTAMVDCQIRPSDVTKYPIIEALLAVPREEYVPARSRSIAYIGDHLALENNRVILDPRCFAKMLDALNIQPDEMVLDLGCGLGYSTAVIAQLAEFVVAVEEDADMATEASANLSTQSVDNAVVIEGSICEGAAKHGPYDVIIAEGGVEDIPEAITDQLKENGRIAAFFLEGALGECRVGVKKNGKTSWRNVFSAAAPLLPGCAKEPQFSFA